MGQGSCCARLKMRKRNKFKPGSFESTGVKRDTSANLYDSMLHHVAFTTLKTRQKILYVYIKAQLYGKRKPRHDYPDIEQLQDDLTFYYNHAAAVSDGLYTQSNHGDFYRDMQELEKRGFIEKISSGQAQRKKNIYRFSNKWQQWND